MQHTPDITPVPRIAFEISDGFFNRPGLRDLDPNEQQAMVQTLFPKYMQLRLGGEAQAICAPISEPQKMTLDTIADEVYFGGRAGCGKSYLLLMAAILGHKRSIIYRKEYSQLDDLIDKSYEILRDTGASFNGSTNIWRDVPGNRTIKFGACTYDKDIDKFRGREYDLVAFDEIATFNESHYLQLCAWARTTTEGQRVRVICAGNPPMSSQYFWVKRRWAAWVDDRHPDPAAPGEVRWFARIDDEDVELKQDDRFKDLEDGAAFEHDGETIEPISRTFIPGQMLDILKAEYVRRLQATPEPMRSQLLYGDFSLTEDDQELQVIPTDWVRAAQMRWEAMTQPTEVLGGMGVDVSRGGKDATVIAKMYGGWFAPLLNFGASETKQATMWLLLVVDNLAETERTAQIELDLTGHGGSPYDVLVSQGYNVSGFQGGSKSPFTDAGGTLEFRNRRAEAWWKFREALDPNSGEKIALPPDSELMADLTAPTWFLSTQGIQIEEKDAIRKRLGRSTDAGDAVVMCYNIITRAGNNMVYF